MLSPLERQITNSIVSGHRNSEIAGQIGISEAAVQEHLLAVMNKLNVTSRVELLLFAYSSPTGAKKAA